MPRYGAHTTDAAAGVDGVIPDLVIPEIVQSAYEQMTYMPLLRQFDVTGPGANFSIPQIGTAMAFAAFTHGTPPDEKVFDVDARTLTPVERVLDVIVLRKALDDSAVNLQDEIVKEVSILYADDVDTLCGGLYDECSNLTSAPDHNIGTDGVQLSFSSLRDGIKLLYTQKAPKPFCWVVHPIQWVELLSDDVMINAAVKGSPVLTEGLGANGFATKVLDCEIYVAEQTVASSGTVYQSLMFSKNAALARAFKRIRYGAMTAPQELAVDVEWNGAERSYEINTTYEAHFEGAKASATNNTWVVTIIS